MNQSKVIMKIDRTIVFWKEFASGVVAVSVAMAGLVTLVYYMIQIVQAAR